MSESQLQAKIIKYLKEKGCYVIKTGGAGTPVGCPDVVALTGYLWLAIEVKASSKAKFQPLQKETLEKLDGWSWARAVYPENWIEVKAELEEML